MKKLPLISILVPTLNAQKHLDKFFFHIYRQNYPRHRIEIIVADGYSTDQTKIIVKKHRARLINNPDILAEPGVFYAMQEAKGELLMILACDNYFLSRNAFKNIANVFSNKKIYAAFPKHVSQIYDSLWTKYINVFTDPFNHYLYGKSTNARTFKNAYKTLFRNSIYDIYDFQSNPIKPIIALAQGFTIRNSFIKIRKDKYDDIISIIDLITKKKSLAYMHSVSLHHQTVRDIGHFIRKIRWNTRNVLNQSNFGIWKRKNTLTRWQKWKLYFYPVYIICLFPPIIRSLIGLIEDREPMWLFHPIITWTSFFAIMIEILNTKFFGGKNVSRL